MKRVLLNSILAIGLTGLVGCANTSPDLVTYRESLQQIDGKLYPEHTQLMADAVKAGIRTTTDQSIVANQIAQGTSIYNTSKSHDAPPAAATAAPASTAGTVTATTP